MKDMAIHVFGALSNRFLDEVMAFSTASSQGGINSIGIRE